MENIDSWAYSSSAIHFIGIHSTKLVEEGCAIMTWTTITRHVPRLGPTRQAGTL